MNKTGFQPYCAEVNLPKIGWVKFRSCRDIPDGGVIKQARIVKRVSGWYVMLTIQWDVNPPQPLPHGEAIGVDVGLISMVATSNGFLVKRPKFFANAELKLKLLRQKAVWMFLPLYCRATAR